MFGMMKITLMTVIKARRYGHPGGESAANAGCDASMGAAKPAAATATTSLVGVESSGRCCGFCTKQEGAQSHTATTSAAISTMLPLEPRAMASAAEPCETGEWSET
eukprot:TRINITY_DN41082_c0_g4_i1.p1 TRINITY_DN41082_c0_g4~~TRINITY_DN41082_c0_g4_i1.p1  ORF type:complete len:106 (-),score=21.07 TRINITY_DN41082_c0_g4_i1:31-348(-)